MKQASIVLVAVAGLAALAWQVTDGTQAPSSVDRKALCSAKPEPPLDVVFEVLESRGELVSLSFRLAPVLPLQELWWQVSASGTATLIDGELEGRLEGPLPARQLGMLGALRVHVPRDGAHKRVVLEAGGVLGPDGEGGLETISVRRVLEWERPDGFAPRVPSRDGETGETALFAAVPMAHGAGR